MVALDTDVLLLAFAFHRDERQADNSHCLALAQEHEPVVAIYSVMELLGQLSFNLSQERLRQWPSWLQDRYRLTILYPPLDGLDATTFFAAEFIERPFRGGEAAARSRHIGGIHDQHTRHELIDRQLSAPTSWRQHIPRQTPAGIERLAIADDLLTTQ